MKILKTNKDNNIIIASCVKTAATIETQSAAFSNLSKSILELIKKETPSFIVYFEKISQIYERLSSIYQNIAFAIDRANDNLSDINERYGVVKMVKAERNSAKAHFKAISLNVENAYNEI